MSPKESHIKMSLETHTRSSSTACSTKTTPSSIYTATTPSTAPTTPATEEERPLGTALASAETQSPTALTKIAQASATTGGAHGPALSALEREYDASRDDLPIEELLARPRLLRSPQESCRKGATNGRTMKPLRAAVAGLSGASGEGGRRGEGFEMEKERVRALGVEMGKLKLPPKKG
jgi:hypothetical protein